MRGATPSSCSTAQLRLRRCSSFHDATHELEANGESFAEAAGEAESGESAHVGGDGTEVHEFEGERVAAVAADGEGDAGAGGADDGVVIAEGAGDFVGHEPADLLGAEIEGVVVAGAEGVGAIMMRALTS